MGTIRKEIQEAIDATTAPLAEADTLQDRIHRAFREWFDVLGKVLNLDADPVAIEEAKSEISAAATMIAGVLLADRPLIRRALMTALPWIIDPMIDKILQYTGTADEFVDTHVKPELARIEESIHRLRTAA